MSHNTHLNNSWNYENSAEWSKNYPCANGFSQSPIDINPIQTISERYSPFIFSSKYHSNQIFTLTNHGQHLISTLDQSRSKDLYLTGGGLIGEYTFVNFHLHWGENNRHGSEHQINGDRFPAEAHFVHRNSNNGQIAVLAFFFRLADEQLNEWDKYAQMSERNTCEFNLTRLMQKTDGEFFRYVGSLTTPPCTEGIIWTVFSGEIPIRKESLELLRQKVTRKNFRPIQPLNDRRVFRNYRPSTTI